MKYKLIASDFDRTLADDYCPVGEYTQEIIKKYISDGGKFCIATGRMLKSILPRAHELGLKGEIIAYQGAVTYDIDTGKILDKINMSNDESVKILKIAEEIGNVVQAYDEDGNTYFAQEANPYTDFYKTFCNVEPTYVHMPVSEYILKSGKDTIKVIILTPKETIMALLKEMREKYGELYSFERSHNTFLEVVNKKASKGYAVKALAEKYGIKASEVMCFGDATNDISMIRYAGLGVAVGNAMDETKAAADYISEGVKEDGVGKTIAKFAF